MSSPSVPPLPAWPLADDDVREALLACYASGDWGRYDGVHSAALRQTLCVEFQREEVLLCSSGTMAVELALRGLKIGAEDEVILAGYDFAGNFRAIEAVGARPVLVDVGRNRWTIDPSQLAAAVSPQTKCILVSHLHGDLAEIAAIQAFAREHGLKVLEDACQVPGARIHGRPAGSFGDVSVLSFGGSKLLTAGRGGAVLTAQADVAQRIRVFCNRGNEAFPLSELQAAVLLPQVKKLAERTRRRNQNARWLSDQMQDLPAITGLASLVSENDDEPLSAFYKLAWRYLPAEGNEAADCSHPNRDSILCVLQAQGIPIDSGFRGFAKRSGNRCRVVGDLANSRSAAEATLLLHHPILLGNAEQLEWLAETMRKVITGIAV